MALSQEERSIVVGALRDGKSKQDAMIALDRHRIGTSSKTREDSGFLATLKDAPSDILGGFKKAGEAFSRAGSDIVDIAKSDDRNIFEKATQIGGRAFGGGAQGVGELILGAGKTVVSPRTERKIGGAVESGARKLLDTETAQGVLEWYEGLPEDVQEQVNAAGGFVQGLAEIAGVKGSGRLLSTGSRVARETAETAVETGGRALRQGADKVAEGGRRLTEGEGVVSGTIQGAKEFGERIPRAVSRVKESAKARAERATRIQKSGPAVQNAIKSGVDDVIINTVEVADNVTLKAYKEMVDIASQEKRTLGAPKRPEIIAGNAASDQYKLINTQRKQIGSKIGDTTKALSKTKSINIDDSVQSVNKILDGEGISFDKKGRLEFSGSRFTPAERTKIQQVYDLATEAGNDLSPSQIWKKDSLFSKLQREARFEGIGEIFVTNADGVDQSLFRVFRDIFSSKLETVSPEIRKLNGEYRKLITLQDDIENSIVKSGNFNVTKGTDLSQFAQTNLRRLGSDAQSAAAFREIASQMDTLARDLGYTGATPEDLINFATALRKLYPETIPPTSFAGGISTGIGAAKSSKVDVIGKVADKVLSAGAPDLGDQQVALKELLDSFVSSGRKLTK